MFLHKIGFKSYLAASKIQNNKTFKNFNRLELFITVKNFEKD